LIGVNAGALADQRNRASIASASALANRVRRLPAAMRLAKCYDVQAV
jgi:hypothetical protein